MHVIPEAAKKMWYHDIPEAEAEECLKTMVRHQSIGVFWSKTTVAAWRYIPTTYIYCGDDRTMPKAFAEKLVGDAKATKDHMIDTVEECEGSGHFPMLSRPDWVVGALKRAAGESES